MQVAHPSHRAAQAWEQVSGLEQGKRAAEKLVAQLGEDNKLLQQDIETLQSEQGGGFSLWGGGGATVPADDEDNAPLGPDFSGPSPLWVTFPDAGPLGMRVDHGGEITSVLNGAVAWEAEVSTAYRVCEVNGVPIGHDTTEREVQQLMAQRPAECVFEQVVVVAQPAAAAPVGGPPRARGKVRALFQPSSSV